MSDLSIDLPTPESAEHIPSVLAAPKAKRIKAPVSTGIAPIIVPADPTPVAEFHSVPPAAVSAELPTEDTNMATTIENMTSTAATGTDKTAAMFGDMSERAKGAMAKSTEMFADMNSFSKGNVEALVESGKIAIAGMQSMTQDAAASMRKHFEEATAAARTMAAVKSPTEFVKLQGDYMRQQFDAMVAETSRSTEATMKLVGAVVQPVANRFAVAVEKIKTAA